jgi:hypothetical protein
MPLEGAQSCVDKKLFLIFKNSRFYSLSLREKGKGKDHEQTLRAIYIRNHK